MGVRDTLDDRDVLLVQGCAALLIPRTGVAFCIPCRDRAYTRGKRNA